MTFPSIAILLALTNVAVAATAASPQAAGRLHASDLRCESRVDPLDVDCPQPRLSWILDSPDRGQLQTAYRVRVATSLKNLAAGRADLWDSGKVVSTQSLHVPYSGRRLGSGTRAYWQVQVWDRGDAPSGFSKPASWEMGLLEPGDWSARWICRAVTEPTREEEFYQERPAPLLRKTFAVRATVSRARLLVSGLGYYELWLNGQRVGNRMLDPAWTNYGRQVLYSTYDVTSLIRRGRNGMGAMLGNGWLNPLPLRMWGRLNLREHLVVGVPRLLVQLQIEYADGSKSRVVTDGTWRTADGPLLRNNVYLGETYDSRREIAGWSEANFDDSTWTPAVTIDGPGGKLVAQTAPAIEITRQLACQKVTEPKPGRYVFDFGQNFGGWAQLRVRAPAGTKIEMLHGELLNPDGTVNARTSAAGQIKIGGAKGGPGAPANAFHVNTYICAGRGEESYSPRFTFHGFRYVEVSGLPSRPTPGTLTGLRLNSAVAPAGEFSCSDQQINRIQEMFPWTLLSNLFGEQSDCPHREKFGYGGDIVASGEAAALNFDMATFYAKAVRDLADAVRPNGGFTETAPYVGIADSGLGEGSGPVAWGTAHPFLQSLLLQYYGDRRLIEEQYEATLRWLALVESKAKEHLLDQCLGDHEALVPKSVAFTASAFYYRNARLAERLANALGRKDDAKRYAVLAGKIHDAVNRRYLDLNNGRYDKGSQSNQAIALQFGLVPAAIVPQALEQLVVDVHQRQGDHFTTGMFGTGAALEALTQGGHGDVALAVVRQRSFPGWGFMLAQGATTLWEHWAYSDNVYSHNHPMFGSVSAWFFRHLGGIRPAEDAEGFDRLVIEPCTLAGLASAKARYRSVRGPVATQWSRDGDRLSLEVSMPPGVRAEVHLPVPKGAKLYEGGRVVSDVRDVELAGRVGDQTSVRIGGGRYRFEVRRP